MARDNYKFAKRGREIAKKKKRQEKLQRKQAKTDPAGSENPELTEDDGREETEPES